MTGKGVSHLIIENKKVVSDGDVEALVLSDVEA